MISWHVISRSGVVISITNCYIRVYFRENSIDVENRKARQRFGVQTGETDDSKWSHHVASRLHRQQNCMETLVVSPDHTQYFDLLGSCI